MNKLNINSLLAVALMSLFLGVNPVFAKIGLEVFDSFTLTFLRFAVALLVFIPFVKFTQLGLQKVKRHFGKLALIGFIAALNPILLFIALKFTQASISPFIYAAVPALTALHLYFVQKKELSVKVWIGIVLGILGVGLIVLLPLIGSDISHDVSLLGNVLIFIAAIAVVFFGVLSKNMQQKEEFSSISITMSFLISTVILSIPFVIFELLTNPINLQVTPITSVHIFSILFMAILGTSFSYFLYQVAIKSENELSASLFTFLQPIITPIAAMILIGEQLSSVFIIGGVIAVFGAWLARERSTFS